MAAIAVEAIARGPRSHHVRVVQSAILDRELTLQIWSRYTTGRVVWMRRRMWPETPKGHPVFPGWPFRTVTWFTSSAWEAPTIAADAERQAFDEQGTSIIPVGDPGAWCQCGALRSAIWMEGLHADSSGVRSVMMNG
jgi:hypothetical protein